MHNQVWDTGLNGLMLITRFMAGFRAGILFAPRSGEETLEHLRHLGNDASISAEHLIDDMKGAQASCVSTRNVLYAEAAVPHEYRAITRKTTTG